MSARDYIEGFKEDPILIIPAVLLLGVTTLLGTVIARIPHDNAEHQKKWTQAFKAAALPNQATQNRIRTVLMKDGDCMTLGDEAKTCEFVKSQMGFKYQLH